VNPEACEQKSGDRQQWNLYIMNSLALFMVDLQMAQGRLLRVFDVLDEMSTAQTPKLKIANAREAGVARSESSLDVRRSTTLISEERWRLESTERHA
jgi:hypothetical protein